MYVGVLTVILGLAALHRSLPVAAYAAVVATGFHLFVLLYEEPHLRRVFGAEYEAYRARVPRWLPRPAGTDERRPPRSRCRFPARPGERAMNPDHDPCAARLAQRPYPHYRALRDQAPVHWAPTTRAWCVSRYDDVMHVLQRPELFSSRAMFTLLMNRRRRGLAAAHAGAMLRSSCASSAQARLNPFDVRDARAT